MDLAAGYQPGDWSDDFVATELSRVTALMDRRDDVPPMTLVGHGMLHIGTSPPVDVTGPPAAMLAWLSGRSDGSSLNPASFGLADDSATGVARTAPRRQDLQTTAGRAAFAPVPDEPY